MTTDERVTDARLETFAAECRSYDSQYQPCESAEVLALITEVQQARQRRCINCRQFFENEGHWGVCELLADNDRDAFIVEPDWFCASFEARL
jgi:hypothetical protein